MSTVYAYKILLEEDHKKFLEEGIFHGNDRDISDGYIHMCGNTDQLPRLINKYYTGKIIYIYNLKFPLEEIKYEESNNQIYPHLYDKPITSENVISYYKY